MLDSVVERSRLTKVWCFLKYLRNDCQYSGLYLISMKKWTYHYESFVENRLEFATISTYREGPQSNENSQITIEELKRGIKV